jgi:hypothetical protein
MRQLKADTVSANLIASSNNQYGPICVYQNTAYRWLTLAQNAQSDITIQGVMSLNENEQLLIAVNQCMLLFLLKAAEPLRILNLGLGTAGIERAIYYLHNKTAYINNLDVFESVEINPAIISVAKQYFNLPADHTVHLQNAELFVATCTRTYNVITIDIFSGDVHQGFLSDSVFWQNIRRCSEQNAQIIINLNPKTGKELQALLVLFRQHFGCIALIEFNEYKNIVVILSQQSLVHINKEEIAHSSLFKTWAPTLHHEINSIYHIE